MNKKSVVLKLIVILIFLVMGLYLSVVYGTYCQISHNPSYQAQKGKQIKAKQYN